MTRYRLPDWLNGHPVALDVQKIKIAPLETLKAERELGAEETPAVSQGNNSTSVGVVVAAVKPNREERL